MQIMSSSSSPDSSPGFQSPPWDSSIIALVGIICMIFLLLSYYKILHRQCCEFRIRSLPLYTNSAHQRHLLNDHTRDDEPSSRQSCGLDSYVMHALPISQFKKGGHVECSDCAVCIGEFEEGDWIKHLPNCSHVFHVSCIDTWFQTHSSCPLCRSFVFCVKVQPGFGFPSPEPLDREEIHHHRSTHYRNLHSQILHSSSL